MTSRDVERQPTLSASGGSHTALKTCVCRVGLPNVVAIRAGKQGNNTMHSFRLRYIVLGLLIYIQSAFCRTCGSKFDDVASRAVQANVVFHGIVERVDAVKDASVDAASRAGTGYYTATFRLRKRKLLKGSLPKETEHSYKLVTVGIFGPDDKEKCITQVKVGSQYIVFLNTTVRTSALDADSPSFRTISGFPEPLSRKAARLVRRTLCKNCGKCILL